MSPFVTFSAWIGVYPPRSIRVHSASDAAMAEVQPKVRYRASVIDVFRVGSIRVAVDPGR